MLRATWARAATAAALVLGCTAGSIVHAGDASASLTETVIVTSTGLLSPVTSVLNLGGRVLSSLPIVNGVEATVLTPLVPILDALPGIQVTPDLQVSVQGTPQGATHAPSDVFTEETGASTLAAAGDRGQGVTVAVLDTGIDNLPDFAGRLIGGVDLTGGGNAYHDGYGHGTFVAGLVAGNGASSGGQYVGEAPGANLVAIKVAGASGTTDMATVISGVQWAINNERAYGIKVLNMSLGFQPVDSTVTNPVDRAVEAAWNSGITVVTSAGNAGPFNGTILSPGDDPLAITVGALDDNATPSPGDDTMTTFSSVGPTSPDGRAKPDLVTSGRSVVSLAAPGSTINNGYPSARIGAGNFVGSGTSFSTAIASGAAALVLADNPGATPDQVKARLLGTAQPGPVGNPFVDGHGALDALAAATAPAMDFHQAATSLVLNLLGALVPLGGSPSVSTWNTSLWTGLNAVVVASTGAEWTGAEWTGSAWNGAEWTGRAWNGAAWNGAEWTGAEWTGSAWNGAEWTGSAWNGAEWTGAEWTGSAWS